MRRGPFRIPNLTFLALVTVQALYVALLPAHQAWVGLLGRETRQTAGRAAPRASGHRASFMGAAMAEADQPAGRSFKFEAEPDGPGFLTLRIPLADAHAVRVALKPFRAGEPTSNKTQEVRDALDKVLGMAVERVGER